MRDYMNETEKSDKLSGLVTNFHTHFAHNKKAPHPDKVTSWFELQTSDWDRSMKRKGMSQIAAAAKSRWSGISGSNKMTEAFPFQKKKANPDYQPPEPPTSLDPLSVHGYYMSMSDYHDRQSGKHARLRDLQRLWSQPRAHHDDRSNFHRGMRDGWAQKALNIDLMASGAGGVSMMKEDLLKPPDICITEERCPTCGDRSSGGQPCKTCTEAFAGSRPTGALDTIAKFQPSSPKVLTPSAKNAQRTGVGTPPKPKIPITPRRAESVSSAVRMMAGGGSPGLIVRSLLSDR